MAREFTFEGKRYRMVPWENGEYCHNVPCPFQGICPNHDLQEVKGPCIKCHPVEIKETVIQEPATFRNDSEQEDWQQVLTIAKSWGWIQD